MSGLSLLPTAAAAAEVQVGSPVLNIAIFAAFVVGTMTVVIKVAGGDDVELTVRSTTHGPIMSDVLPGVAEAGERGDDGGGTGDQAVSLAWTALTPSTTADAIFALNTAKDWDDFREAARDFSVPS
ncbi:hypothetical protein HN289_19920, partial [Acinetobacter baumannii]|nr:hypothetical protein [Acinetobacter baumannii]